MLFLVRLFHLRRFELRVADSMRCVSVCVCVCKCCIMIPALSLSPQPWMKANLCHSWSFSKWELVAGLRWPAAPLPFRFLSAVPTSTHTPPHKRRRLAHNKPDSHRSPSICATLGIPWTKMPFPTSTHSIYALLRLEKQAAKCLP